ncbi:MAG TPA: type 4a pilus biogenesis protein PilO [Coriobacteriia bacterium]|jgi:Tfp pilus assembly protein PilO
MKLSSRDQMIVAGVLIAIVAVLFFVFLIMPRFSDLGRLDTEMAKAQADTAQAQQLLATRQAAKAQAAETQARLTRLDNQMPDAPELASLIIDLQDTANDAGVQWNSVSPVRPVDVAGYQKLGLSFSVEGQWDDVVDYLRRLSELERSVRVLSVDIQPKASSSTATTSTADQPHDVRAGLALEVYSMPRVTSPGGAAPGAPAATAGH